jgi:hypothetical protein
VQALQVICYSSKTTGFVQKKVTNSRCFSNWISCNYDAKLKTGAIDYTKKTNTSSALLQKQM